MENLGEKLKSLRLDLGLTQTEMAAGVISVSFYSKVERGLHSIGAEELLEILKRHDISAVSFFSDEKEEDINKKKLISLMNKFVEAANNDDNLKIEQIICSIEQIKPRTNFINSIILQAKIISDTHDSDAVKELTINDKNKIKKIVFQKDTDGNEYLRIVLIANTIQIYSLDEARFLVESVIRRYKNITNIEKKVLIALSVLMINYIDLCIKMERQDLCREPLIYIRKLPNAIELAFSKILGKYYEALIQNKLHEAKKIRDILINSGYEANIKRMSR